MMQSVALVLAFLGLAIPLAVFFHIVRKGEKKDRGAGKK